MQRILCFLPVLLGCPDYNLKGTLELSPGAVDTAAPADDSDPLYRDTGIDTGEPPPDDPEDPPPTEECDGEDNDGDGLIDEGFDDTDGDGIVDCLEIMHTVDLTISVDDVWEGWVDGSRFASEQAGWNVLGDFSFALDSGPHVIAIHGWDTGAAISGHISTVRVDGALTHVTGDGSWQVQANTVPAGWRDVGFDDSAWMTPVACVDLRPWESWVPEIMADGAVWTWYSPSGDCRDPSAYGSAYYRLHLYLP